MDYRESFPCSGKDTKIKTAHIINTKSGFLMRLFPDVSKKGLDCINL